MKKILFLGCLFLLVSCSNKTDTIGEIIPPEERTVTLEFETTEPNSDEIQLTYYDYKTDAFLQESHTFEYTNSGDALPLKVIFRNYDFRYINGEAFRNNPSRARLTLKVFVNEDLVLEDSSQGTGSNFATVRFNYTIRN